MEEVAVDRAALMILKLEFLGPQHQEQASAGVRQRSSTLTSDIINIRGIRPLFYIIYTYITYTVPSGHSLLQ